MSAFIDLTGRKFGRLTAIRRAEKGPRAHYLCICECGKETIVRSNKLVGGYTRSCGCIRSKGRAALRPTYQSWDSMVRRCTDPGNQRFADYGGRGITVCDRWKNDFEAFLADVGIRPDGHTIERIDNEKNYEPGNCRWATDTEQKRNMRSNVNIEFNGKTQCLTDWATELGIKKTTLQNRLYRGWSVNRAFTIDGRRSK